MLIRFVVNTNTLVRVLDYEYSVPESVTSLLAVTVIELSLKSLFTAKIYVGNLGIFTKMDKRREELTKLKSYTEKIDNELTMILQNLQWDRNHLLQVRS